MIQMHTVMCAHCAGRDGSDAYIVYTYIYIYTYMCIHSTQWSVQGGEAHVYLLLYQKYLLYLSTLFKVCLFFVCTLCREGGLRYICYYRFHSLSASTRRCLFFFQDLKRKLKVLWWKKRIVRDFSIYGRALHTIHPPPYSCSWELGQFH